MTKRATMLFAILLVLSLLLFACQPKDISEEAFQPEIELREDTANAEPTIHITRIPGTVNGNEMINIFWEIRSELPLTAIHTAVHYDTESHPGTLTSEDGPENSGYPRLTEEYASGEFFVPEEFTAGFIVPDGAGRVYLRAHTIIEDRNYWTEERIIEIVKIGCEFNNPDCNSNEDCIDNKCVLKPGCAYNNPACGSGFRCRNNECIRRSSGGGGGGGY